MAQQHSIPYPHLQNQAFQNSATDLDIRIRLKAVPDDQGPYPSCTYFALSKAIVNGYFTGKFTSGKQINIASQLSVSSSLLNLQFNEFSNVFNKPFKISKNPTQFDKKTVLLPDANNNLWETKINVSEVQSPAQELMEQNFNKNEYLIYYSLENNNLHCVYVDPKSSNTQTVRCINSWGEKKHPFPEIPFNEIKNLFKVTCVAKLLPNEL